MKSKNLQKLNQERQTPQKTTELQALTPEELNSISGGAWGMAGLPGTGLFGHMVIPVA